jgi:3-hydroxybutyryl-CoA dehydrogenase
MSISHGIRQLGVLGAGQMGTGIALVSALRAKVPVLLHDRSSEQVSKGLSLVDKLLTKDVAKGRLTKEEAKEARDKITVVNPVLGIKGLRDVDMVIEVLICLNICTGMLLMTLTGRF